MHLYHVHTKINIPSINNENKCPRQEHHVTVISLLTKKAAVMLAEQHGQIQSTECPRSHRTPRKYAPQPQYKF